MEMSRLRSVIVVPPPPREDSPPPPPPKLFTKEEIREVKNAEWGIQGTPERRIGGYMKWEVICSRRFGLALDCKWKDFLEELVTRMREARTREDGKDIWRIVEREAVELKDMLIERVFRKLEVMRDAGELETNRKWGSFQSCKSGFRYLVRGMLDDVLRGGTPRKDLSNSFYFYTTCIDQHLDWYIESRDVHCKKSACLHEDDEVAFISWMHL
ncbi:hypothetical protein ACHWQZ_G019035 [Mnemiopsis leidyi]